LRDVVRTCGRAMQSRWGFPRQRTQSTLAVSAAARHFMSNYRARPPYEPELRPAAGATHGGRVCSESMCVAPAQRRYATWMASSDVLPSMSEQQPDAPSDAIDADLAALPAPPRHEKRLAVVALLLVSALSAGFAVTLRTDLGYAMRDTQERDLGSIASNAIPAHMNNQYVHVTGMLGAADAIRYERPFSDGSFRLAPLMGRTDTWVEMRVPPKSENGRFVPPAEFRGRLVRVDDAGARHRGLSYVVTRATGLNMPAASWLLVVDEDPKSARWSLALAALCAGFFAVCIAAVFRISRRIKSA
jgi:hypothetical protein